MVINPIVGVYIPFIRIPIKGGMTIPNIATFDHGTYLAKWMHLKRIFMFTKKWAKNQVWYRADGTDGNECCSLQLGWRILEKGRGFRNAVFFFEMVSTEYLRIKNLFKQWSLDMIIRRNYLVRTSFAPDPFCWFPVVCKKTIAVTLLAAIPPQPTQTTRNLLGLFEVSNPLPRELGD